MRLLFGCDATIVRWAELKNGWTLDPPWIGIGIIDDAGALKGALVLQRETPACAELTIYSEDAAITPGIARAFFRHVFCEIGVWRLQVRTDPDNKSIRKAAPRWGFKFECRATGYWGPGEDALVYAMTPDRCRWIARVPRKQREGNHVEVEAAEV